MFLRTATCRDAFSLSLGNVEFLSIASTRIYGHVREEGSGGRGGERRRVKVPPPELEGAIAKSPSAVLDH